MSLTTSDIATCPSHSLANTCKNGHIVLTGCFENLKALNTSSSLESGAAVIIVLETFDKLDGLQIVGPDVERTSTTRLADVIMASILDNQAQVEIASKVDTELNMCDITDIDRVGGIAAECTGAGWIVGGHTCTALK